MKDLLAALNLRNLFSTLSFLSSLTLWNENKYLTFLKYVKKKQILKIRPYKVNRHINARTKKLFVTRPLCYTGTS